MIKNITKLEVKINGRDYQLMCEIDSPIPDVKEATFQFQKYIGQIEDNLKAQQEAAKAEKESKVTPISEDSLEASKEA